MTDPRADGDRATDSARWVRVREVLEEVVELPDAERSEVLRRLCGGDDELGREVRRLLAAESELGSFLDPPGRSTLRGLVSGELTPGQRVGPWRIERFLGRGGMGEVHLASRADGSGQRVALKVIRAGSRGTDVLRRFRRERRVLAHLRHPGIARLIDGGATPDGLPFLAMEYVEGEPIDRWCERRGSNVRERLELFGRICAAVQHAHRCLVVHRDLKPSNILVTSDGEPKLLDFGIAKMLAADEDTDPGDRTTVGRSLLTPAYASPEQLRQEPVTTATDVYSLGVILYELLCGARPHDLGGLSPAACERVVGPTRPRPPSERLQPGGATTRRRRALAGDLDTIALTALRTEPQRRYASVGELAWDVERHLAGLPIAARPDTVRYRAAKFVARHRGLVGSLAGVFLVLVAGLLASQVLLARARTARQGRQKALEQAQDLVADLGRQAERAARARQAEASARRRADGLFENLLESSVANVFDFGQRLRDLPGGVDLRLEMVSSAVGMLEKLSATSPRDADIRYQLLRATLALAEVQDEAAAAGAALPQAPQASRRRALELGRELVALQPARAQEVDALLEPCRAVLAAEAATGDPPR